MRRPHAATSDTRGQASNDHVEAALGFDADEAPKRSRASRNARRALALGGVAALVVFSMVWLFGGRPVPASSSIGSPSETIRPSEVQAVTSKQSQSDAANVALAGGAPGAADSKKKVAKVDDEEAQMNALLDDLLELHRKDVAQREAATVPPQDLPVFHAEDSLVVSMADGGYAACVVRLVESVRKEGRWGGDVVVLVPTGEGTLPLAETATRRLTELGASLSFIGPEAAGGAAVRGAGSATQYAKVALLADATYRRYSSILFLDADGLVGAPLQPLLALPVPLGRVVAMPTWPSVEAPKETFYAREISLAALTESNAAFLRASCPDRLLVGITAWFLLKPQRLEPPEQMRAEVDSVLSRLRPAFRFNDQGLWNVLFYNTAAFYPLCLSGPSAGGEAAAFKPLLLDTLDGLEAAIVAACGTSLAKRRPMYAHPLKDCVPPEEWERKKRANRELSDHQKTELGKAFDEAAKVGRR